MRAIVYVLVFLLLLAFSITLNIKNSELITVNYYFDFSWSAPLAVVLGLAFILGVALGVCLTGMSLLRSKWQTRQTKRKLSLAEQEVENLRAAPIRD